MYRANHKAPKVVIAPEIVPVRVSAVIACVLAIVNSCPLNPVGNTTVRLASSPAGVSISFCVDDATVTVAPDIGEDSSVEDAGIVVLHIFIIGYQKVSILPLFHLPNALRFPLQAIVIGYS